MVKVGKCCCCFPVKVGAYIIGITHVIGLVLGALWASPFIVALEVTCGISFLVMYFRDSEQNRLFYFSAYCVYVSILFTFRMIFTIWDHDENQFVASYCTGTQENLEAEKKDWLEKGFTSYEDCKSQVGSKVVWDEALQLFVTIFVQVHFILVLYTHYKNANMTKEKGGCLPNVPQDIQMGNSLPMDDMNATQRSNVAHAVDDEDLNHSQQMSQLTV